MKQKKTLLIFSLSLSLIVNSQLLTDPKLLEAFSLKGLRDPEVVLPKFDLVASNQKRYNNDSLLNKVTFINFWFEACLPCIAEIEPLNNLFKKYSKDSAFQFLSFTTDLPQDIPRILLKYQIPYPLFSIGTPKIYDYNFQLGFPSVLIIDKSGKIRFIKCGGGTETALASKNIETLYYPEIDALLKCKK